MILHDAVAEKGISGKLQVGNRTQAIGAAQRRGMLHKAPPANRRDIGDVVHSGSSRNDGANPA